LRNFETSLGKFKKPPVREKLEPVARLKTAIERVNSVRNKPGAPTEALDLLEASLGADLKQSLPSLSQALANEKDRLSQKPQWQRKLAGTEGEYRHLIETKQDLNVLDEGFKPESLFDNVAFRLRQAAFKKGREDFDTGTPRLLDGFRKQRGENLLPYSHALLERFSVSPPDSRVADNLMPGFRGNAAEGLLAMAHLHSDEGISQALRQSHHHLDDATLPGVHRILQASLLAQAERNLESQFVSSRRQPDHLNDAVLSVAQNGEDAEKYVKQVLGDVENFKYYGGEIPTFHHALHPASTSEWLSRNLGNWFPVEIGGHSFGNSVLGTAFQDADGRYDLGLPQQTQSLEDILPKLFKRVLV
jgi:hypothetical protein